MRIVFVGKSNEVSLKPLDALAERHAIVGVVESPPRGLGPRGPLARAASEVRRRLRPRPPLAARARAWGVPFLRLPRGPVEPLDAFLSSLSPDLLVIASLSRLLPEATIAIPRHGTINLHPSLLPRFRGPFPILWQYLEYERTFGVTVHLVDAREDAGDILAQEPFEVAPGTPLPDVLDRASTLGAHLAVRAADDLAAGRAVRCAQGESKGPRARAVRRDEPLVDWDRWPIERVWHALIGTWPWLDPYRGAVSTSRSLRARAYERGTPSGAPGTIGRDEAGWYAHHPEGKIRLVPAPSGAA